MGNNSVSLTAFNNIFRCDPTFVARRIAGEMILVPVRRRVADLESIFLLNETALFAWQLFDGVRTLQDIRCLIVEEFDVDENQAGEDLLEVAAQLEQIGALVKA